MHIYYHTEEFWDVAHDIVVGNLCDLPSARDIPPELRDSWATVASIPNIAFHYRHYKLTRLGEAQVSDTDLCAMFKEVQAVVDHHGPYQGDDLKGWSVKEGLEVSGGYLRNRVVSIEALHETVDAFITMLNGEAVESGANMIGWRPR